MGIYEDKYDCGCLSTTTTLGGNMQTFVTKKCNKDDECSLKIQQKRSDNKFNLKVQETLSRLKIDEERLDLIRGEYKEPI